MNGNLLFTRALQSPPSCRPSGGPTLQSRFESAQVTHGTEPG